MGIVYLFFAIIAVSAIVAAVIAKKRGLNPIFWSVMGLICGPLVIPFVFWAKVDKD